MKFELSLIHYETKCVIDIGKLFDPFRLQDIIEVDAETKEMLKMMDFQSIPGLQMTTAGKQGYSVTFTSFALAP